MKERNGFILLMVTVVVTIASCGDNMEREIGREVAQIQDSVETADSTRSAVQWTKSLRLSRLRDSLRDRYFAFSEKGDYLHRSWEATYYPDRNSLFMLVDELGLISFVSCLTASSKGEIPHTVVMITSASDTTWLTDVLDTITRSDTAGVTAGNEYVNFGDWSDACVRDFILTHRHEEIKVTQRTASEAVNSFVLTDADKQAVADCVLLSQVINGLSAL